MSNLYSKGKVNLKELTHHPQAVAHRVGQVVAMDLVGPMSKAITSTPYLLTMMDRLSRYVVVAFLPDKKAETVATAFLQHWIQSVGGVPETVIMDQGREFVSRTTRGLMRDLGCEVKWTQPENHQSNPVERFHRTLWNMARSIRTEGVNSWSSAVRTAVGIYNQQVHTATGVPPNRLFLGRDLHLPGDLFRGDPLLNEVHFASRTTGNRRQQAIFGGYRFCAGVH